MPSGAHGKLPKGIAHGSNRRNPRQCPRGWRWFVDRESCSPARDRDQAGIQDHRVLGKVGLVVAILVSAAVINGGDNGTDEFIARQAWLYVSILGAGYFISRGLAKSGSSEPYTADDNDR